MSTNAELQKRRQSAVPRGVANFFPIYAERAENAEIWDVEGKRYIDFAGGIGVLNVGHNHPRVKKAVQDQVDRCMHTCFQVVPYEPYIALAERLNELAPGTDAKKTIFLTTGAEAVENAVKIARAATGRSGIVSFAGAFHGRTMMTLGLTGKVAGYKTGFGPFPADIYHAAFPNDYNGVSVQDAIQSLDTIFKADLDPNRCAAIIVEPVQGEGGFNIAPFEFLHHLRKVCDEHGILLISDEIQSGFARTGKWFAIEHSGVVPDLIATAKSLAGGMPLSGVIGRADIMDAVGPGGLGGTYGGNPVACAAALGAIDAIEEDNLLERSIEIGERVTDRFKEMATKNTLNCIGDVRNLGGMIAVELVKDRETREPATELTGKVLIRSLEKGLVVISCGVYGNAIRVLVPLTASEATIDQGLDIIESSILEVLDQM